MPSPKVTGQEQTKRPFSVQRLLVPEHRGVYTTVIFFVFVRKHTKG